MAPVTKTIHFQNGTIINANNSISRPLSIAKQGKDLTAQLAEDIAEEMADDPTLQVCIPRYGGEARKDGGEERRVGVREREGR